MQTQAITAITVHGCASSAYWWVWPVALFAGIGVAALVGRIRDRRSTRRAVTMIDMSKRRSSAKPGLRIEMVIGDITGEHVDAIVNAAKPTLLGGGGVDGAIHKAGGPAILRACRALRATLYPDGLPTGRAVATTAGELNAEHVIHTVGPIYNRHADRSALLRSCYTQSLAVADELGARTVAFPLISSGVYGWPVDDAVMQALTALQFARTSVQTVRLVFYDDATYYAARAVERELS